MEAGLYSFIQSFTHSFNKQLLYSCLAPGTVLEVWERAVNKIKTRFWHFVAYVILEKTQNKEDNHQKKFSNFGTMLISIVHMKGDFKWIINITGTFKEASFYLAKS